MSTVLQDDEMWKKVNGNMKLSDEIVTATKGIIGSYCLGDQFGYRNEKFERLYEVTEVILIGAYIGLWCRPVKKDGSGFMAGLGECMGKLDDLKKLEKNGTIKFIEAFPVGIYGRDL